MENNRNQLLISGNSKLNSVLMKKMNILYLLLLPGSRTAAKDKVKEEEDKSRREDERLIAHESTSLLFCVSENNLGQRKKLRGFLIQFSLSGLETHR